MPFSDINANPPFPSSSYFMMNYLLRIDHEVEFAQPETELSASERSFSQHRGVIIPVLLSAFRVRLMAEAKIFFLSFPPETHRTMIRSFVLIESSLLGRIT